MIKHVHIYVNIYNASRSNSNSTAGETVVDNRGDELVELEFEAAAAVAAAYADICKI